jgi:hypothetical protein
MRIFLGTNDVAKILTGFKEGFLANGCTVTTLVKDLHPFYEFHYDYTILRQFKNSASYKNRHLRRMIEFADYNIQNYRIKKKLSRFIEEHDVFVFIWSSLLKRFSDYPLLKKANKKIVNVFVGSEIRHISAFKQEFGGNQSTWEQGYLDGDLNSKLFTLRNAELYSDLILSVPDQSGLAIRPYDHLYIPFNGAGITFNPTEHTPLRVIHAPSKSGIKGSSIIISTIERLRSEGIEMEFKLIQNVSNNELMKELNEADVLVDELYLHGPGTLGLEGMAAGCAVATHTMSTYKDVFNPPVCSIDEGNIYEQLKVLFTNKEYRSKLIHSGKKFLEEKTAPAVVAKSVLDKLITSPTRYDYYPDFYINRYKLPANTAINEENLELTRKVLARYSLTKQQNMKRAKEEKLVL